MALIALASTSAVVYLLLSLLLVGVLGLFLLFAYARFTYKLMKPRGEMRWRYAVLLGMLLSVCFIPAIISNWLADRVEQEISELIVPPDNIVLAGRSVLVAEYSSLEPECSSLCFEVWRQQGKQIFLILVDRSPETTALVQSDENGAGQFFKVTNEQTPENIFDLEVEEISQLPDLDIVIVAEKYGEFSKKTPEVFGLPTSMQKRVDVGLYVFEGNLPINSSRLVSRVVQASITTIEPFWFFLSDVRVVPEPVWENENVRDWFCPDPSVQWGLCRFGF